MAKKNYSNCFTKLAIFADKKRRGDRSRILPSRDDRSRILLSRDGRSRILSSMDEKRVESCQVWRTKNRILSSRDDRGRILSSTVKDEKSTVGSCSRVD